MSIVERVKAICLKPNAEWGVIEQESTSTADLFKKYAIPLAAIGPIAAFIGYSLVGVSLGPFGTFRWPIGSGLGFAVQSFALGVARRVRRRADHQRAGAQLRRAEEPGSRR